MTKFYKKKKSYTINHVYKIEKLLANIMMRMSLITIKSNNEMYNHAMKIRLNKVYNSLYHATRYIDGVEELNKIIDSIGEDELARRFLKEEECDFNTPK